MPPGLGLVAAMGSFSLLEEPRCNGLGCRRWAGYIADGFGPACGVCMQSWCTDSRVSDFYATFPIMRTRLLHEHAWRIAEFLDGDGREDDCLCGWCLRAWCDQGWVCPVIWHRHVNAQYCWCGDCELPWFFYGESTYDGGWRCPHQRLAWAAPYYTIPR